MASYLRPRRGKKATALSQNITLKAGEVFFETPTTGVGTGAGRIMMGDGSNNYTVLNNNKRAFITNVNSPKVKILIGNVIRVNAGFKDIFTILIAAAAINADK